jgi:uncharacterized membrane protein
MSLWNSRPIIATLTRTTLAAAAALFVVASVAPAEAGARGRAPWCGNLSGDGQDDCNYFTFEQCLVSVRGVGGICARNPAVYAQQPARPRKLRRAYK